jgi:hypothetical protein
MGNNAGSPMCGADRVNSFDDDDFETWSPRGSMVYLNIYHLDDSWSETNKVSNRFGLGGAFHAGIEVHGVEWTFGMNGIYHGEPRSHQVHVYHDSVPLGGTSMSAYEVEALIADMRSAWQGEDYHMFEHNCCNFADALSQEVVGGSIPQWVGRLPQIAAKATALGLNVH